MSYGFWEGGGGVKVEWKVSALVQVEGGQR